MATSSEGPPLKDKLACVRRELALRRAVYPRLIVSHKLTAQKAEVEPKIIETIVADYERLAADAPAQ